MKVTLITYTPEPEKVVATAAKLCYSSSDITTLQDNLTDENIQKFVSMLANMHHESPFEHVSFTFGIEGVSRSLTHQLVRHRIASYSQKSQRYVSEDNFEYIIPEAIKNNGNSYMAFNKLMDIINMTYKYIEQELTEDFKTYYLCEGCNEKTALNKAKKSAAENARAVLPNACETKIIATFNARSLFNFFAHRCCNRAQDEIRELATEMYKLVYAVAPNIFKYAGPNCVATGKCPEGNMCCGKMKEMKDKFDVIKNNSIKVNDEF